MAPGKIPPRWKKRFDILAYAQEFNWVSVSEMVEELHVQGVDVTRWMVAVTLREQGWEPYQTDSNRTLWMNPEREPPKMIRRE